jgi:hypothetical protein
VAYGRRYFSYSMALSMLIAIVHVLVQFEHLVGSLHRKP